MRFTTLTIGTLALAVMAAAPAPAQESRRDRERREREEQLERERADRERDRERSERRSSSSSSSSARTSTTWYSTDDSDRAVMGINTSSSGERDTLGLLITSVTPGSPAEKAGLEEGNRIAEINGVNLRLDPADAGESDMNGIQSRRLTREMRKVRPGDEVELKLWQSGQYRTIRFKTIAADELTENSVRISRDVQRDEEERAVVGLTLGSTGSRRDTLGALVVRVEEDGPAERAGIVEGDRIQSINGVDLRVAREDAGDEFMSSSKTNRFSRELRKVRAGDKVEIRIYSGGQSRTVTVTTMPYEELYKRKGRRYGVVFGGGYNEFGPRIISVPAPMPALAPMPPMPPMPARALIAPRIQGSVRVAPSPRLRITQGDDVDADVHVDVDVDTDELNEDVRRAVEERLRDVQGRLIEAQGRASEAMRRAQAAAQLRITTVPAMAPAIVETDVEGDEIGSEARTNVVVPSEKATIQALQQRVRELEAREARTRLPASMASMPRSSSRVAFPGLVLGPVNPDLASYFGSESRDGLLVLEADAEWAGLSEGDVILTVDGECVLENGASALRDAGSHKVELIRGGKRQTVELAAK